MTKFNNGKPYHGSDEIMSGKLQGLTDTDYFYFFCPRCPDKHILRILDYKIHEAANDHPYNSKVIRKAKRAFTFVFHLYCDECQLSDFVKISNTGWQCGPYADFIKRL